MPTLLIISPNFPPVNAADMHRVRQSVSYFEEFGWKPIVVSVKTQQNEAGLDPLLVKTLPDSLEIHWVGAFSTRWTRKFGLGALGLRSLWFYFITVNKLLKAGKFDLIYFSTTMFPVLVLGHYWKKRFNIPYIIDMQDPWRNDFYKNKPKHERPPKYWFSYNLNKYMEPIAMKNVDGIISVSQGYCDMLQIRYKNIIPEMCTVIPFGAFEKDFQLAESEELKTEGLFHSLNPKFSTLNSQFSILYVGRGGADMTKALRIIFSGFKKGLEVNFDLFSKINFYFIGTSYARGNMGKKTIEPVAEEFGVGEYIFESPARVSYFTSLKLLADADMLIIPGSVDPNYTASKLYPYIMSKKPLLAVFSETSSVVQILKETNAGEFITFKPHNDLNIDSHHDLQNQLIEKWTGMLIKLPFIPATNWKAFEPYTAREMTKKQAFFFNKILKK